LITTASVLSPRATGAGYIFQPRQRLDNLKGKVVGFIDNAKPNFEDLVDDLGHLLVERYGVATVVNYRKPSPNRPAPDAWIQDLSQRCDLVITGSAE
jgi:hypothetical protein